MLDAMITWTADLVQHVAYLDPLMLDDPDNGQASQFQQSAPVIPDPKDGGSPPFQDEVTNLLGWGMWGALTCCVAGFLIIGARMGIQHKRGEGGGHMGSMAIVGFATVLIMSAYAIVNQIANSTG